MSSRSLVAAAALSVCLSLPAIARAQTWTSAASEHFEVYTSGNDRRAREALVYFERVHTFFADFLKLEPKPRRPTRVIIFSNAREFQPYALNEFASAYYAAGPDRDYIVMRSFDSESYPVVVHEYAHLIARHSGAIYPPWLNEGLADFFSTLTPEGNDMGVGRVPLGRHQMAVKGPLIDLARLIAVDHNSPEYRLRDHAGMFYAQSWALTHMILTSDAYRARSSAFIEAVGNGTPTPTAFSTVFGKTVADVFGDLRVYLRNDRFLYFTAKYRDPKIPATFPVRTADRFETRLVLANLLANRAGRADEARAAFEALSEEKPGDLELLEARAMFEYRQRNPTAAEPHLAKAVAANSRNAEIYRALASVSDASQRLNLLRTALSLDDTDLNVRLAYVSAAMAANEFDAAKIALEAVRRVPPEQAFMYLQLAANVSLRLGQFEDAKTAAVRSRQFATEGAQTEYVERLIQSIDGYMARQRESQQAVRQTTSSPAAPAPSSAPTPAAAAGPATQVSRLTGEILSIVTGTIRSLTCDSQPPVLEVLTADATMRFAIDDPLKITIEGTGATTTELTCGGLQRPARIGYAPLVDGASKTVGRVRLLDFR